MSSGDEAKRFDDEDYDFDYADQGPDDDCYQLQPLRVRAARWWRHMPVAALSFAGWLVPWCLGWQRNNSIQCSKIHSLTGQVTVLYRVASPWLTWQMLRMIAKKRMLWNFSEFEIVAAFDMNSDQWVECDDEE